MGVIIKQSIKNTLISYVGIALGFVSTILLYPRILSPEQYGLTRLLISLALVCAQAAELGFGHVIIRYFPYFKNSGPLRSRFFSLVLMIPLAGFLLFVILFLITHNLFLTSFHDRSALFTSYYLLLIPLVFGLLFFGVMNSYLRALHDAVTGSLVQEIFLRVFIIILLIIYYFNIISFPLFMAGFIAGYCFLPLYLAINLYQKGALELQMPAFKSQKNVLKKMSIYGGYSLLSGMTSLLVNNIDIIMLGAILDLKTTAVYAIAFYVGSVIAVPQKSIVKIANPVLAGLIKDKKTEEIRSLYKRTSLTQLIAGSLLYIGIWANMHNLMTLLPVEYRGAKWIILIIGIAKLFNMATGINGGIIDNSRYYRFDLYANIFLVVMAVATNYLLIPIYGMLGAAIATMLSIVIYNTIKLVYVRLKFSMQPFEWNTPAILALAAGCLLLSFLIPYLVNFFVDVIVRSLAITVVFIGIILLLNLSDDVSNLARETVRRTKMIFK